MKRMIRLTESDLHRIVKESVEIVLKETSIYPGYDSTSTYYKEEQKAINSSPKKQYQLGRRAGYFYRASYCMGKNFNDFERDYGIIDGNWGESNLLKQSLELERDKSFMKAKKIYDSSENENFDEFIRGFNDEMQNPSDDF